MNKISNEELGEINQIIKSKFGNNISLKAEELYLVAGFMKEKGLSIFSNDFYIISFNGKNQIVVSIEGIRKCARSIGSYSLEFKHINSVDNILKLEDFPNKSIYGIQAILKLQTGEIIKKEVLLSEFIKNTTIWEEKPVVMLQKIAEASVLRMAFNLGGMYTPEEFSQEEKPVILKDKKEDFKEIVENYRNSLTEENIHIFDEIGKEFKEILNSIEKEDKESFKNTFFNLIRLKKPLSELEFFVKSRKEIEIDKLEQANLVEEPTILNLEEN